jgi:MinD-like ATPase involved in chromosome partitioning or flagellar assembly
MMDNLRKLCARWNARGRPRLDPDELLALPRTEAIERYRSLHENVIAGPAPYAQIAIEYEIEMLSIIYGPTLLDMCKNLLGEDVLADLSFLVDHVTLDAGHTAFNRRQIQAFLEDQPEAVAVLVDAGSAALDAYGGLLPTA